MAEKKNKTKKQQQLFVVVAQCQTSCLPTIVLLATTHLEEKKLYSFSLTTFTSRIKALYCNRANDNNNNNDIHVCFMSSTPGAERCSRLSFQFSWGTHFGRLRLTPSGHFG